MLKRSWIRSLSNWLTTLSQHRSRRHNPQRNRSRQVIEALECRMLLSGAPVVTSINLVGPATTDANKVTFTATFSEPVTGVDPTDFALVKTGTVDAKLTQVTAVSQWVYTVTVSGVTGSGTLGLNLVDDSSIRNMEGTKLTKLTFYPSFKSGIRFTTEPYESAPYSNAVALGDVNGDAKTDLIILNGSIGESVGVLLGNGDGSFQIQHNFDGGYNVSSVTIGDVNGDGKLDLIVANNEWDFSDSTLSVLLGNGDGTFESRRTFVAGSTPTPAILGDVNGDGDPDLVVANFLTNTASVLFGNGDGTFQSRQTFSTGYNPLSVTLGDVNGDANLDIAVSNCNSQSVSVLLGNGDGTFQSQRTFATGYGPTSVSLGDLDDDGRLDLVVANTNSDSIGLLLGNGNGTFQSQKNIDLGTPSPYSLTLGDVNGDGKIDFVFAYLQSALVGALLGDGKGSVYNGQDYYIGDDRISVTLGDVNGDGQLDIIIVGSRRIGNTVSLLLGNVIGDFTGQTYTIHSAPVLRGLGETTTYTQNGVPVSIAPKIDVFYPDVSYIQVVGVRASDFVDIASATVSFTNWQPGDRIEFSNRFALQHTFTEDLVNHTATLTITGTTTGTNYLATLGSIVFWSVSGRPSTVSRTATFTLTDIFSGSGTGQQTIEVKAVNQLPFLSAIESTPLRYAANHPEVMPQPISGTLLVTDPDSDTLSKAIVQITSGYQNNANGRDLLAFTNQLGITGVFNAATGTLTLTGSSSVSNYRTALRSVTFSSSGKATSTVARTLTINAFDDSNPAPLASLSVKRDIIVSSTNVAPQLSGFSGTSRYLKGSAPLPIAPNLVVSDSDSSMLFRATISFSNWRTGESLDFSKQFGLQYTFTEDRVAHTASLTITGRETVAHYQAVLRSIGFSNVAANPILTARVARITVSDGFSISNTAAGNLTVRRA